MSFDGPRSRIVHAFGVVHSVRNVKYLCMCARAHRRVRDAAHEQGRARRDALVADLLDVEQAALGADVGLAEVVDAVDDGGTDSTRDTVVVRFPHAAECRDIRLVEEVLGIVCARA